MTVIRERDALAAGGVDGPGAAADADEPTSMHPITLALPAPLEAKFWAEFGTPAYATVDRWALLVSAANSVVAARAFGHSGADPGTAFAALRLLLAAWMALNGAASCAAWVLLAAAPGRYYLTRDAWVACQRLSRVACVAARLGLGRAPGWLYVQTHWARAGAGAAQGGAAAAAAAEGVIFRGLLVIALFLVTSSLFFPMALRRAAPHQALAACLLALTLRDAAAVVRADPGLSSGARLLCARAAGARDMLLAVLAPSVAGGGSGGSGGGGGGGGLCEEAPYGLLICLTCALPCALTLYVLYEREHSLKRQYLAMRGHAAPAPLLPQPLRAGLAGAAIALASFAAAEGAARWAGLWER